jgi:hypothetical protein
MELGSIILFIVFLVTVLGTLAELLFSKSKKGDSVEIPNQPAPRQENPKRQTPPPPKKKKPTTGSSINGIEKTQCARSPSSKYGSANFAGQGFAASWKSIRVEKFA